MTLETYQVDTFPLILKRIYPSGKPKVLTGATVNALAVRLSTPTEKITMEASVYDGPAGEILIWIPSGVFEPEPYTVQVVVEKDNEIKTFQDTLLVHRSFGP